MSDKAADANTTSQNEDKTLDIRPNPTIWSLTSGAMARKLYREEEQQLRMRAVVST